MLSGSDPQYGHPVFSGGGICHRHKNRALGDTFLKFGMVLEQAMRFLKTTDYRLVQAAIVAEERTEKSSPHAVN